MQSESGAHLDLLNSHSNLSSLCVIVSLWRRRILESVYLEFAQEQRQYCKYAAQIHES